MLEFKYMIIITSFLLFLLLFIGFLLQYKKLSPYWKKVFIISLLLCLSLFALMLVLILGTTFKLIYTATNL